MYALLAATRMQLWHSRRKPGDLQALVVTPLSTVIFLAIVGDAQRPDLVGHAVLAPALIGVITMSLITAGDMIDEDRFFGTLEPTVAAPTPLTAVVTGRVLGITLLGQVAFVESWLVAWLAFGEVVTVAHPGVLLATLLAAALGMTATSTFMAALFVVARSARIFQNSLSYPLYALGGVLVPVSLLPGWLEPVARLLYVSWAADLLRDALAPAPVGGAGARLAVVLALSAATFGLGAGLLHRLVDRVRRTGALAHA